MCATFYGNCGEKKTKYRYFYLGSWLILYLYNSWISSHEKKLAQRVMSSLHYFLMKTFKSGDNSKNRTEDL